MPIWIWSSLEIETKIGFYARDLWEKDVPSICRVVALKISIFIFIILLHLRYCGINHSETHTKWNLLRQGISREEEIKCLDEKLKQTLAIIRKLNFMTEIQFSPGCNNWEVGVQSKHSKRVIISPAEATSWSCYEW